MRAVDDSTAAAAADAATPARELGDLGRPARDVVEEGAVGPVDRLGKLHREAEAGAALGG